MSTEDLACDGAPHRRFSDAFLGHCFWAGVGRGVKHALRDTRVAADSNRKLPAHLWIWVLLHSFGGWTHAAGCVNALVCACSVHARVCVLCSCGQEMKIVRGVLVLFWKYCFVASRVQLRVQSLHCWCPKSRTQDTGAVWFVRGAICEIYSPHRWWEPHTRFP